MSRECKGGDYQSIWQVVFGFITVAGVIITMIFGILPHIKNVENNIEKKMESSFEDIKKDVCVISNRIDSLDKNVKKDGLILREHSNSIIYQGLVLDKLEKRNPLTKEELEIIMRKTFYNNIYDLQGANINEYNLLDKKYTNIYSIEDSSINIKLTENIQSK